jgi:hypothetical protein
MSQSTPQQQQLADAAAASAQEAWVALAAALAEPRAPAPLLAPLRRLHAARQRLGDITATRAASLVAALQQLLTGAPPGRALQRGAPIALDLLARWASSARPRLDGGAPGYGSGGSGRGGPSETAILAEACGAVLSALQRAALPPAVVGPALGFLGAACTAGAREGAQAALPQAALRWGPKD